MKFSKDFKINGEMAKNIYKSFLESGKNEIILFNIGTDKIVGDSLAPLLGTKIVDRLKNIRVYGTLDNLIHAKNINKNIEKIHRLHSSSYIIAVDAAIGKSESIGSIILSETPIKPGAAFNKDLPEIGNCSIVGIVSDDELYSSFMQNIGLSLVYNMVLKIESELVQLDNMLDENI